MRKIISLVLALICALSSVGCNHQGALQQGDHNMQYFFTAKVIEVHEEYLHVTECRYSSVRLQALSIYKTDENGKWKIEIRLSQSSKFRYGIVRV